MRVFVYYNLHRKLWSIRAVEGPNKGRVVAHSDTVLLHNAHGKVSQAGRRRVLAEGRKNVHAGIVGTLVHTGAEGLFYGHSVTYNPYKYTSFVYTDTLVPFEGAEYVYMHHRQVEVTP